MPYTAATMLNLGSKSAPGTADANAWRPVMCRRWAQFIITIASINTTVDIECECSHDALSAAVDEGTWAGVKADGESDPTVQYSANGSYVLNFTGEYKHLRLRFASEDGGTAAVVSVSAYIN